MRRRQLVPLELLLADVPPAPPCFSSAMVWRGYIRSTMCAAKTGSDRLRAQAIVIVDGRARINPSWNYCTDCDAGYRRQQQRLDRCRPQHLAEWCASREGVKSGG